MPEWLYADSDLLRSTALQPFQDALSTAHEHYTSGADAVMPVVQGPRCAVDEYALQYTNMVHDWVGAILTGLRDLPDSDGAKVDEFGADVESTEALNGEDARSWDVGRVTGA
ncbi:hypothetical protein [Dactylosporangium sp. CA-092794]|uniref:hypothetical protein n=1 Tax=Dactylosporangium sp. CA-092794 TaxID=3239929 RepID=UPI003D8F8E5F